MNPERSNKLEIYADLQASRTSFGMKIVISGYTYSRQNLFEVFDEYPEKQNLFFILPNNWKAKGGKVIFKPFKKVGFNIYNSPAYFYHSRYPLIGGLLKGWMPFFVFRLAWLRLTKKAGILFTTGEPNLISTLYNGFFAKLFGMKHIFHFWENIPYELKNKGLKLWFKKLILRLNIDLSDGAICGMRKAEEILRPLAPKIKIGTFLHSGINTEKFRPGQNGKFRTLWNASGKTVFLFVGALGYRKGIHVALDALAELKEKHDNLYFLIVGSGEYEKDLKLKIKNLKLENFVKIVPWMDNEDLPEMYASADIFLYPSIPHEGWEEQFGYSIAEASACGLPVVSTRSGSIEEVVKDNQTGILIEPDSKEALSNAMDRLILDRNLCHQIGRAGRKYVENNFSNKIIAHKLYNFFKDV